MTTIDGSVNHDSADEVRTTRFIRSDNLDGYGV